MGAGATAAAGATGSGAAGAAAGAGDYSHGVALRLVFVTGTGVADGHVVLTPWLRERLGVVQGSRVTLTPLTTPSGCSAPLLRLRPTASSPAAVTPAAAAAAAAETAKAKAEAAVAAAALAAAAVPSGANGAVDASESSSAGAGATVVAGRGQQLSTLAALGRPHRLVLGLAPDVDGDDKPSGDMTAEELDGAAQCLVARWVATQAKFSPGGGGGGGGVPVASGTVLHFRLREHGAEEEVSATFELDVLTTGGVALLHPEQFEVNDADNADVGRCRLTPD